MSLEQDIDKIMRKLGSNDPQIRDALRHADRKEVRKLTEGHKPAVQAGVNKLCRNTKPKH